ncbi:MAG TPA: LysM peptidoglycan-binding domain-containing protein, partial [Beijerinckiaceae bacterium]|nr:LysM peptidoglycan-binding domain-containing protein [Beijerinckiaceae bacterium]
MRQRHRDHGSSKVLKLLGAAMIAGMSGACSSDILRFSDTPFANPFNGKADQATTGSVNAPLAKVRASSLGMPQTPEPYQPFPSAVGGTTASQAAMTQVAAAGNQPVLGSVAGWSATGGTPVTAGAGDTVEALSGRYGVPVQALRQINGIKGQPSAGQQVIIPAYNPGMARSAAAAPSVTRTAPPA